jgi:hypothetical protein
MAVRYAKQFVGSAEHVVGSTYVEAAVDQSVGSAEHLFRTE